MVFDLYNIHHYNDGNYVSNIDLTRTFCLGYERIKIATERKKERKKKENYRNDTKKGNT